MYSASEGLSVLVLDGEVLGGQAGASGQRQLFLSDATSISFGVFASTTVTLIEPDALGAGSSAFFRSSYLLS